MSHAVSAQDAQELRRLIPLNILSGERFQKLCAELGVEEASRGTVLFKQGDDRNEFVYVLSGTVSLQAGGMEMEAITGGTESAKFALAHQIPRKVSAIARNRVRFIRVDSDYVNQPGTGTSGTVATYEVSDLPEESTGDWMATLLNSPIFQRLPPANLQLILSNLEEVQVTAGQEIIHQDEPGDYYYVIKKGRCALSRKPSRLAREIKLAELKTCDTFGEDSLISDQPRNVTVTMISDGSLLRLGKEHFLKLVKEPVIATVGLAEGRRMVAAGARWLDVRTSDLFEEGHFPGAINIPFFKLRVDLGTLDRQHPHILVCETGRISEAAAFLLIRNHFEAYVLKGGLASLAPGEIEVGDSSGSLPKPSKTFESVPGESSRSILAVAPLQLSAGEDAASDRERELRAALDDLKMENQALKNELDTARGALADLHTAWNESQAAERELSDRVRSMNVEVEDARGRVVTLTAELERLSSSPAHATETAADQENWEARLQALEAERERLGLALKDAQEAARAGDLERNAWMADKAELERALKEQRAIVAAHSADTPDDREFQRLLRDKARIEQEKDRLEKHGQALEGQVAELSAVVREFIDRQQAAGEQSEEVLSLQTELETIREQATTDVMAMRAKLRGAEQEVVRLKSELGNAQQRLLTQEVERMGPATSKTGRGEKGRRGWLGRLLGLLAAALFGAIVALAVALGTNVGRDATRQLVTNIGGQPPAGSTELFAR
jgi:CRP-like cAMP-binding protein/predicted  nucleic acid-binding Zn-ribbon protein